jgi:uncharacterized protein YecE (DUF72 family)
MEWHIGTIGFSYGDWQKVFYPDECKPSEYLSAYATAFNALELDTTFHAIPPAERVQKWADAVPDGFTFCVKTPKQITHDAPIAFGSGAMKHFLRTLRPMQQADKLGPILIQFSPLFPATEFANLEAFLKDLPTDFRYAVEFRNSSWENQRTHDLLKHYRCGSVAGDYGADPFPIHATTDFLFLRLIGVHEQFTKYDHERIDMTDRLSWWQEQAVEAAQTAPTPVRRIFAFCTDDYAGHAPATANRLRALAGLPARIPAPVREQGSLF